MDGYSRSLAGHDDDDLPCPQWYPGFAAAKHLLLTQEGLDSGTMLPLTQRVPVGTVCIEDATPEASHV